MSRSLYLVAYDVCNPRRMRRVCKYLTGFKVGGQKSVYECWLTPAELRVMRGELDQLMEPGEDRLHIVALDPRMKTLCFGLAAPFEPTFFSIL